MLIGAEGEEAPRNVRGKRSAWSGNQQTILIEPNFQMKILKNYEQSIN